MKYRKIIVLILTGAVCAFLYPGCKADEAVGRSKVTAYDLATGQNRWQKKFNGESVHTSGSFDNGAGVEFTFQDTCWSGEERQLVINTATGDEYVGGARESRTIPEFSCEHITDDNLFQIVYGAGICFGQSKDDLNRITAYDYTSGEKVWERVYPSVKKLFSRWNSLFFAVALLDAEVTDEITYGLARINPSDGEIMWALPHSFNVFPSEVVNDTVLISSDPLYFVMSVNAQTGDENWRIYPIEGSLVYLEGDSFYVMDVARASTCEMQMD